MWLKIDWTTLRLSDFLTRIDIIKKPYKRRDNDKGIKFVFDPFLNRLTK